MRPISSGILTILLSRNDSIVMDVQLPNYEIKRKLSRFILPLPHANIFNYNPRQNSWNTWSIPLPPFTKLKITLESFPKLRFLTTLCGGEGTALCMPKKSEVF